MEPEITILQASVFNNRKELEDHVVAEYGKTTEKKNAIIQGTTTDLLKLSLSHGQVVWGVVVEVTDYTPEPVVEKPQRGQKFNSSLNYSKNEAD